MSYVFNRVKNLFNPNNPLVVMTTVLCSFVACCAAVVALKPLFWGDATKKYTGRVRTVADAHPIANAKVSLDVGNNPFVTYTDSEGFYSFVLDSNFIDQSPKTRVSVEINGTVYIRDIVIDKSLSSMEEIRIDLANGGTPVRQPSQPPSATPIADPELQTARQWNLIFSDDFSDTHNNWNTTPYADDYAQLHGVIRDGRYYLEVRGLKPNQTYGWALQENLPDVTDFYLRTEVRFESGASDAAGGIVFRFTNTQGERLYYVYRLEEENQVTVNRVLDNFDTPTRATIKSLRPGDPYTLEIIAQGDRIQVYLDSELVVQRRDDKLPHGRIAPSIFLPTAGTSAVYSYDNLEIRTP